MLAPPAARTCSKEPRIRQLVAGQIAEEEAMLLDEHLLTCASCAAIFDSEMAGVAEAIGTCLPWETDPDENRSVNRLMNRIVELVAEPAKVDTKSDFQAELPTLPPSQAPGSANHPGEVEAVTAPPSDSVSSTEMDPRTAIGVDQDLLRILGPAQHPGDLGSLGRYRILSVLGQGGMGAVFNARDPRLDREVAVKVILPTDKQRQAERCKRFLREARAVAALRHINVIEIYECDEHSGVPYQVMPLLKGEPLSKRLKREPRLPFAFILNVAKQTAVGLAAAHNAGLVHRDLKPDNLFLEENEDGPRLRILDFGLACWQDGTENLSVSGMVMGTPAYMSPQQAIGETVDSSADVFSLGVILYEMVTGVQPFAAKTLAKTLARVEAHTPERPDQLDSAIPKALGDLVMKLLDKDPAGRPTSRRVVDGLDRIQDHLKSAARTTDEFFAVPQPSRKLDAAITQSKDVGAGNAVPAPATARHQAKTRNTAMAHGPRQGGWKKAFANQRNRLIAGIAVVCLPLLAFGIYKLVNGPKPENKPTPIVVGDDPAAAKWVLSVGGTVTIKQEDKEEQGVQKLADLPEGKFDVVAINLATETSDPADEDLGKLTGLRNLTSLRIAADVGDTGVAHLKDLPKLNKLEIRSRRVTNDGLKFLRELTNLKYLTLISEKLTDDGLAHLAGLTQLERLTLNGGFGGTRITGEGLIHLKKLDRLKLLSLNGTQLTDAGLKHLKDLKKLTELDLGSNKITGNGLVHLGGLTNLEILDLTRVDLNSSSDGLTHLAGLTKLKKLVLSNAAMNNKSLAHLKPLTALEELNLATTESPTVDVEGLKLIDLKNLSILYLNGQELTDADLVHLQSATKLTALYLQRTKVTAKGVDDLATKLPGGAKIVWGEGKVTETGAK